MKMSTTKENQCDIAAIMKRRSLFATTREAIEEWKRQTVYTDCPVVLVKAMEDENDEVWIDKKLFTDVIAFLLEFARRSTGNDQQLKLTVSAGGLQSSRIVIDYTPLPELATEMRSPLMKSHFNEVILQIVSQHSGTLEFNEERHGCKITLILPPVAAGPQRRCS